MKKIVRIDIKAHEVARTINFYQLDQIRNIKLCALMCIELRRILRKHNNRIEILNEDSLIVLLNEIEYRKIIGINIIKPLKI